MREVEEIRLETRAGRFALLHWPAADAAAPKVLCLHGWLDNAASFLPLAQHLTGLDLYALDFPGHGHSDHRPPGVRYTLTEYVLDLDAVLDTLGWETARFIGHSMGGGVSCLYAAALPERVDRIVLADGLGPHTVDVSKTASQLRASLEWARRARRPLRRFDSIEAATRARENGFLEISSEAARVIVERAVRQATKQDGGEDGAHYMWRTDPALKWDSPVLVSEAQILSCLEHVTAPVLSFHAQPWTATRAREHMARRQAALRQGIFRDVEGNHHFHMDEAERIAPEIEAFFKENDT